MNAIAQLVVPSIAPEAENVTASMVQLSPTLAASLLQSIEGDGALNQRAVTKGVVELYARQMREGKWQFNGEPLIVSAEGYLMDGQHRCQAVVKSGVTVNALLLRGVGKEAMDTIDQGKGRTRADVLSMAGFAPRLASTLATAGNLEILMSQGSYPFAGRLGESATPKEIKAFVESNAAFVECAEWALGEVRSDFGISASLMTWLYFRFSKFPFSVQGGLQPWLSQLVSGAMLEQDDPRLWIRSRMTREAGKANKTRSSLRALWVIKAWRNADANRTPSESNFFSAISIKSELNRIRTAEEKAARTVQSEEA